MAKVINKEGILKLCNEINKKEEGSVYSLGSKNDALKHDQKMRDIAHKASEITRKEANRRDQMAKASGKVYDKDFDSDYQSVMDATNRHIRRHDRVKTQNESVYNIDIDDLELD